MKIKNIVFVLALLVLVALAGCAKEVEKTAEEFGVDVKLCPAVAGDVIAGAYFCPEDNCDMKLISEIGGAKAYVHAAVYSFTLDSIGDALIDAHGRGVEVKVVLDKEQAQQDASEYGRLKDAGIEVRLDANPDYMHNKFAVIDGNVVATGSYNWTLHASEGNDENLIIIASKELAAEYEAEFWEIFNKGN